MNTERLAQVVSILCILMMPMGQIGIDIYSPAMPSMVSALHTTPGGIQLTVTLYTIGLSFALLVTGPIIDYTGRYKPLLVGLTLYTLSAFASTAIHDLNFLLVMRVMQGLGAGIIITSARACFSDCFTGEALARVFANMAIVWSMGPVLAPYIGGYLTYYIGWKATFLFMAFYGVIILVFTIMMLSETLPTNKRHEINSKRIFHNFKRILTTRTFIGYILVMTIAYSYIILFSIVAPFIIQTNLGYTPVQYGKVLLIIGLIHFVSNLINKRMIRFYDSRYLILGAIIVSIVVSAIQLSIAYFGRVNIYVVLLPTMFIVGSIGFIYANCVNKTVALFQDIAGANSALVGFIPMLGCAGATVIATKLPHGALLPVAAVTLVGYLLALLLFISLVDMPKKIMA